jgi:hypothetical protein
MAHPIFPSPSNAQPINPLIIKYTSTTSYPPGTKGFFYYHQPPTLPPVAGELRFRICDTASQFTNGKDLEINSGQPWRVPLHSLSKSSMYSCLRDVLLEEGLVDPQLMADVARLLGSCRQSTAAIYLSDIDQPFIVNLNSNLGYSTIHFMTRHSLQSTGFQLFSSNRTQPRAPYEGWHVLLLLAEC